MRHLIAGLMLAGPLLYAQVGSNSVTVTVSRSAAVDPDQVVFRVTVTGGLNKGLDEIVAGVQGSGITAAHFAGIGTGRLIVPQQGATREPLLDWYFELPVALSRMKDTSAALTALQGSPALRERELILTWSVAGAQVSPERAGSQTCSVPDLMGDARAEAQRVAAAAGFNAGDVLSVATATSSTGPVCSATVRFALGIMVGRTEPNSVTVTATRTLLGPPDELLLWLSVTSDPNAVLDDVQEVLRASGITGAVFAGVGARGLVLVDPQERRLFDWQFRWTVPVSRVREAVAQVLAARQAAIRKGSGWNVDVATSGVQASTTPQCRHSDLVSDARAHAQRIAAAAGGSLGAIIGMAAGPGGVPGAVIPVSRLSGFLYSPQPAFCSTAVQFQLLRN